MIRLSNRLSKRKCGQAMKIDKYRYPVPKGRFDYSLLPTFLEPVEINGEQVMCEGLRRDIRTMEERERDVLRGSPEGNVLVLIPGHAQTVDGPRELLLAAARLCRSRMVWCIDPVPAKGGDVAEAKAVAKVVKKMIHQEFNDQGKAGREPGPPVGVTFIGWSHGGAEALRAAEETVFSTQFLGLCPAGLRKRHWLELLLRFNLEVSRILLRAIFIRRDQRYVRETFRVGWDMLVGVAEDYWRTRNIRRILEDIRWACQKVVGLQNEYDGEVVLLFGKKDTVIRWQAVFPRCEDPSEIPDRIDAFQKRELPHCRRLEVAVVEGDHVAPEADPETFLRPGLELLGQLADGEPAGLD
jgi:hypothetical protein